jgi:hypothetical protein
MMYPDNEEAERVARIVPEFYEIAVTAPSILSYTLFSRVTIFLKGIKTVAVSVVFSRKSSYPSNIHCSSMV